MADHSLYQHRRRDEGAPGRPREPPRARRCEADVSARFSLGKCVPSAECSGVGALQAEEREPLQLGGCPSRGREYGGDLVQKTEVAITLMKTVLGNVRPFVACLLFLAYDACLLPARTP